MKKISPFSILGIVFTGIGCPFLLIAVIILINIHKIHTAGNGNPIVFLIVFGSVGLVFFVLGLIFLFVVLKRNKTIKNLIQANKYVMAQVSEICVMRYVRINDSHPYVIYCIHTDEYTGKKHVFKSDYLRIEPNIKIDSDIKVYCNPDNIKKYYVDIEPFTKDIILH